jgi:hypothetical protein
MLTKKYLYLQVVLNHMKTIYKYQLQLGDQRILLPENAQVLSTGVQNNKILIWVLVDTDNTIVPRLISVVGTGWEVPDMFRRRFIGTLQIENFVWHVFEEIVHA